MEFMVVSRDEIEQGIIVRTAYVVISITDPGSPVPRIIKSAGFRDALRLRFHDAVPGTDTILPNNVVLMTSDHARQIWDFVFNYQDRVDTVVVHCEQGMSRSPAIAAALAGTFDDNNDRFFLEYQPNEYVYKLMRLAAPGSERDDSNTQI
jgi:predicted protein tyrosine phosphatase